MEQAEHLAKLRREVRTIRRLLEEVRSLAEHWSPPRFRDVVRRETLRAERYNHYFALVVVSPAPIAPGDLLELLSGTLRASDAVGVFGPDGRYWRLVAGAGGEGPAAPPPAASRSARARVGILMPETDRAGADRAMRRLNETRARAGEGEIRFGTAVFPDDGTRPDELIQTAVTWSHSRPE